MLLHNLGRDYVVWEKAATIRFRNRGTSRVRAEFGQPDAFRAQLEVQEKIEPMMIVKVLDEQNEVVAEVEKLLYIRRKEPPVGARHRASSFRGLAARFPQLG